jgi:hypothetical protein
MTIPKLTDHAVAELPLEAGRAELLEEIMSVVAPDRPTEEPTPVRHRSRWLVPLAVAAAVATVASTPLWWGGAAEERAPEVTFQTAPESPGTGYRAVLTAPGWEVSHVEEDSTYGGEVGYEDGGQELAVTWYPAKTYEDYLRDRQHIEDPQNPAPGDPVTVLGADGQLWAYSDTDHAVMREPGLGHWMEIRGRGMDRAAFEALLGQLRLVSLPELEATLPAEFVTQAERPAEVEDILAGIERVSRATVPAGTTLDTSLEDSDPYQLGAAVAGQYACAWIAEFVDAKGSGDQARADEAARVLGTSRGWPILQEMDAEGDYPEVVWESADEVAAGQVPEGYREGLGC